MINFMDEKLFKEVDKLPMNYPRIKLMKEHFVAAKQNLWKHIFNDWVSRCTLDIERIKDLATSLWLFFDFKHQTQQSWKHLEVNAKLLRKT